MAKRRRTRPANRVAPAGPAKSAPTTAEPGRSWVVPAFLALVILGAAVFVGIGLVSEATAADYSCESVRPEAAQPEGAATPNDGAQHVAVGTRISYPTCPPTSGDHYSARGAGPLPPAFYGPDAEVGPGGWVHNLEHGFVVALYRCEPEGCPPADGLSALRDLVPQGPSSPGAQACGYPSKVVVARFDDMSTPFAVLAWDRAMILDSTDASAAESFAARWIEATAPEPGAC